MHNTWHQVSEDYNINLSKPDRFGVYSSNGTVEIKHFILDNEIALLMELEFMISVQGRPAQSFLLGYEKILPQRNDIGNSVIDGDSNIKLIKGPAESYFDDLVLSDDPNTTMDGKLFEFSLKAYVSALRDPPKGKLQRINTTTLFEKD